MSREIEINVTAEDIANGERDNCLKCPVARAAQRVFPGEMVDVSQTSLYFKFQRYVLPLEVQGYISLFDKGVAIDPFSFKLVVDI